MIVENLRNLCIKNNYFTSGTNKQYDTMFKMAQDGSPIHDVALLIWVCSKDADLILIEKEVTSIIDAAKINDEFRFVLAAINKV